MVWQCFRIIFCQSKNKQYLCVYCERKKTLDYLHLYNMNKSEAATMRCSINRWSIIYCNLRYCLRFNQKNPQKQPRRWTLIKNWQFIGLHCLFRICFLQDTISLLLPSIKRNNKSNSVIKWCLLPEIIIISSDSQVVSWTSIILL